MLQLPIKVASCPWVTNNNSLENYLSHSHFHLSNIAPVFLAFASPSTYIEDDNDSNGDCNARTMFRKVQPKGLTKQS